MKKILQLLVLTLAVTIISACSSKHKAKDIETDLKRAQNVNGETLGLKDGEMVIQKKRLLAEEVRRSQVKVYELEDRVYGNQELGSLGLYGVLKSCRSQISSKEYGGSGKLMWTEPLERVTTGKQDAKLGIDENDDLVAVKEEYLLDRLTRFKKFRTTLLSREIEFQNKVDICQAELRSRKFEMKK